MAGGAAYPGLFGQAVAEAEEKKRQYGQLTGYEPIPGVPGGYNFQTAAGRSLPFTGAQAEQMRQQVDAAQNFRPLLSTKSGGTIALREGGNPANPNDIIVEEPGRAATKGGLQLRNVQSRGGYELDPERMGEIQESQEALQASYRAGVERQQQAAAERQGAMEALRAQASNEAAVMAHENTVKQQRLDASRASYQKAEADFLNEPERQKGEREKNKGKDIVNQIAMAIGALGASMARTPNFVANTIEAQHERDMRREEAELRVKKEHKDSLLGRLRDEMGSMDVAQAAYRSIRTKESALKLEQLASKESDAQRSQELLQAAAVQNQNYLKWQEQLERGQQGEVDKSFLNVPGSPGRAASRRRATADEAKGLVDLQSSRAGIAKTEAETGKTRAELASGGAGGGKLSDSSANAFSNVATAKSLVEDAAAASRAAGRILATGELASSETTSYLAKADRLANVAAKAIEGDAASESHVKAIKEGLNSGNPDHREAALTELYRVLDTKDRAMRSVVPGAPK